jgi:phosphohistidine swiveling domain-containing protein
VQYRGDRSSPDGGMAALVQEQVNGVFSGVAFSRDPISRQGDAVVIEALPGGAERVVSGQVTPEQYRVWVHEGDVSTPSTQTRQDVSWVLPEDLTLVVEGTGDVPSQLLQQVAYLVRQLELRFRGIPLDMEWTYDGQQLWVLQARPITTLVPIWTRKIAAEVIPGLIHPLTWSINRPLTCGVWGDLFTIVLGDRAKGLDFTQTATLHHSSAYFNATLLGDIFLRMGLPPESLEFLTRGAKFSKPPLMATVRNLPGLLRLFQRELTLVQDFATDDQTRFAPALDALHANPVEALPETAILDRIDEILQLLNRATYYSILAPLSLALRQALLKPADSQLDNQDSPEVASVRSLYQIAEACRPLLSSFDALPSDAATVMQTLRTTTGGEAVLAQFDQFLKTYGYLSDVATDVAVPRWREAPETAQALLVQALSNPVQPNLPSPRHQNWKARQVQQRLSLKGRVTEVYSRLLAELRWSLVALEVQWRQNNVLSDEGDLFFLTLDEIRAMVQMPHSVSQGSVTQRVNVRRTNRERDRQLVPVPRLVYGNDPPHWNADWMPAASETAALRGIGASPGIIEGWVTVLSNLQTVPNIDRTTILVVPYTDSGWAPLLSQAGGLIAEVGGRLSHGAIIAREYGIPAVMDVHQASQRLRNGQRIRLDGQQGTIEILM